MLFFSPQLDQRRDKKEEADANAQEELKKMDPLRVRFCDYLAMKVCRFKEHQWAWFEPQCYDLLLKASMVSWQIVYTPARQYNPQ